MKKLILALSVMLMLTSCATGLEVGKAVSGAAVVDEAVMSGEVLNTILTVELSGSDMAIVEDTYDFYMQFRQTWAERPELMLTDPLVFERFKKDYTTLTVKYNNLKGVVLRNSDRYDHIRLSTLRDYDRLARLSHEATVNLIESGENARTLSSALEFGTVVGRMMILLL